MKIAITVLCYGGWIRRETFLSLSQDQAWCLREGHSYVLSALDMHGVDRARNLAVREAMSAECDLLLMCDADTAASPEGSALEQMVAKMREHGCEAISAVVPLRHPQLGRVNVEPAVPFSDEPLTKSGAALLLLDLHRLAKIAPGNVWFRFVVGEDGITPVKSEDLYFAEEIGRLGGEVRPAWLPTIHIGTVPLEISKLLSAAAVSPVDTTLAKSPEFR